MFDEEDVDLLALSASRFEEACFDLLLSLGFQGLRWRQGGADDGRDIEGRRAVSSSLVGAYDERWFFECKRYQGGVPPEELNSKIAWADAERPNHLVILTTSHLTVGATNWLEKLRPQKPYAIHVVDGKALRRLFSVHSELMIRYFVGGHRKLLLDARRNWLVHGIIPEAETLRLFAGSEELHKATPAELAFLWCSAKLRVEDTERLIDDSEPFYFDHIFEWLSGAANTEDPVVSGSDDLNLIQHEVGISHWEHMYSSYDAAVVVLQQEADPRLALYSFVRDAEGEGLEVLVEASSDFPVRIRHMESGAAHAVQASRDLFFPRGTSHLDS